MPVLLPKDSIDAAVGAYAIEGPGSDASQKFSIYSNLTENFDFQKNGRFESTSGAFLLKSKSGFGVIAKGKGKHANEAMITIRGTATLKDWLTDGNIGTQMSSTGKIVHAGFNRVFKEFEPDLRLFFRRNDVSRVHCIGHSLGGALAGMTADWVENNNCARTYLYTFGSPRIGFQPFSTRLTEQTGKNNIFRVHHNNDIVSLIPIWPYMHIPQPGLSCCIQNHGYNPMSAHYKENYSKSLKGVTDWGSIKIPAVEDIPDDRIKKWLSTDTVMVISRYTLNMIGSTIKYILKVAGVTLQLAFIGGLTILDQLSYALDKAVQISKSISEWMLKLIRKITSALGIVFDKTVSLTAGFIKWVLNLLTQSVYRMARSSLNNVF